jgi:hypothetical protein
VSADADNSRGTGRHVAKSDAALVQLSTAAWGCHTLLQRPASLFFCAALFGLFSLLKLQLWCSCSWCLELVIVLSNCLALLCMCPACWQVWYGAPEYAAEALEVAVQDCLPHLWTADRQLLQQQVTAVSPNELRARGVPVYRSAGGSLCCACLNPGVLLTAMPDGKVGIIED